MLSHDLWDNVKSSVIFAIRIEISIIEIKSEIEIKTHNLIEIEIYKYLDNWNITADFLFKVRCRARLPPSANRYC